MEDFKQQKICLQKQNSLHEIDDIINEFALKINKTTNGSNGKVKWSEPKSKRHSSGSISKKSNSLSLKVYSKYSSKGQKQKNVHQDDQTYQNEDAPIDMKKQNQVQFVQINEFDQNYDERQQNILLNKKISNYKYLIGQTKQLLKLTHGLIINQKNKQLRNKIIETQIMVHRLRISSRKKYVNRAKVMEEYYKQNVNPATNYLISSSRPNRLKSSEKTETSSKKYSAYEYYRQDTRSQDKKEQKKILMNRKKNLQDQIRIQKAQLISKQILIKEQIQILRQHSKNISGMAQKTCIYSSDLAEKVSSLALNSNVQNHQLKTIQKKLTKKLKSPKSNRIKLKTPETPSRYKSQRMQVIVYKY